MANNTLTSSQKGANNVQEGGTSLEAKNDSGTGVLSYFRDKISNKTSMILATFALGITVASSSGCTTEKANAQDNGGKPKIAEPSNGDEKPIMLASVDTTRPMVATAGADGKLKLDNEDRFKNMTPAQIEGWLRANPDFPLLESIISIAETEEVPIGSISSEHLNDRISLDDLNLPDSVDESNVEQVFLSLLNDRVVAENEDGQQTLVVNWTERFDETIMKDDSIKTSLIESMNIIMTKFKNLKAENPTAEVNPYVVEKIMTGIASWHVMYAKYQNNPEQISDKIVVALSDQLFEMASLTKSVFEGEEAADAVRIASKTFYISKTEGYAVAEYNMAFMQYLENLGIKMPFEWKALFNQKMRAVVVALKGEGEGYLEDINDLESSNQFFVADAAAAKKDSVDSFSVIQSALSVIEGVEILQEEMAKGKGYQGLGIDEDLKQLAEITDGFVTEKRVKRIVGIEQDAHEMGAAYLAKLDEEIAAQEEVIGVLTNINDALNKAHGKKADSKLQENNKKADSNTGQVAS